MITRYVRGLLKATPMLAQLIEAERQEGTDLSNRLTIEVHSASFRTTRDSYATPALNFGYPGVVGWGHCTGLRLKP